MVSSRTGKKALGENIDAHIAELKKNVNHEPKGKAKAKPKATPRAKNKEVTGNKKLQKEIKGFLV